MKRLLASTFLLLILALVGCNSTSTASIGVDHPRPTEAPDNVRVNVIEPILGPSRSSVYVSHFSRLLHGKVDIEFLQDVVLYAKDLDRQYQVLDVEMILAIIWVESKFNPKAFNNGSIGLMQVEEKSHVGKVSGRDLRNPRINMEVGAAVWNQYFTMFGSIRSTLLSYNAGPGNFRKGRYDSTYYKKVMRMYSSLKGL